MSRNLHLSACDDVIKYTNYTVCPVTTLNLLASYRPLVHIERPGSVFFIQLSSNGFFYPGRGVSVTCISCDNTVELIRFVSELSSAIYHKPGCEFIKVGNSDVSSNVDMLPSNPSDQSNETASRTTLVTNNNVLSNSENAITQSGQTNYQEIIESSVTSLQSSGQSNLSHQTSSQTPQYLLPIPSNLTLGHAANPVYSTWNKRMESLVNWPKDHIHSPTALADAGFFYAGYSDCVRCFHCGLGLRSWKPGDDIYVEHERYRPTCSYLQALQRNKQQTCIQNESREPMTDVAAQSEQPHVLLGSSSDFRPPRMHEEPSERVAQGSVTPTIVTVPSTAVDIQNNQSPSSAGY
ncbi:Baculoviral IAP repeat-containing protein 7-B [Bulinus truncatus]|nr:Baculoviral IAP repeat-containing protein 7-B [Bulinus truncatus]